MSRNLRRKPPVSPARAKKAVSKRRGSESSSSLSLSSDDGYSAVDDISDAEDDDEDDVDAVEEMNIVTEAVQGPNDSPRPPRNDDGGRDDDDDTSDEDQQVTHHLGQDVNVAGDDGSSWPGIASDMEEAGMFGFGLDEDVAAERHVRFDIPPSPSDSTETEDDDCNELFPDIFISQASLDPNFRREIEHESDNSSGSGTFWDYHGHYDNLEESEAEEVVVTIPGDEAPLQTPTRIQVVPSVTTPVLEFDPPQSLDGYESDGETTEDEIPEPLFRKKSRRSSSTVSDKSDSEVDCTVNAPRGQPRLRRFKLDRRDKKPIAVFNPHTRKMMIFTPQRRHHLDLSPEQFNFPMPTEQQPSPMYSNSASMMLSAMFSSNTFGDFLNTHTMGPAEAFFPFTSDGQTPDGSSSPPSGMDEDGDEAEKGLDISDFITWDGHSDDGGSSGDEAGNSNWEPSSTPMRPTTASSDRDVLSHLNSETVGAFRRNQINQQLILSNKATQDSLAFSGPYNYTALRGLKSDRFDTAGMPLTPARRHKKHVSDFARSPLHSVSAKRKAFGDVADINGHKKQRSISTEVNRLHI